MSINPIFTHIPRTGLAPVAHASRRLRGKGRTVVGSIHRRLKRREAVHVWDVLDLRATDPKGNVWGVYHRNRSGSIVRRLHLISAAKT